MTPTHDSVLAELEQQARTFSDAIVAAVEMQRNAMLDYEEQRAIRDVLSAAARQFAEDIAARPTEADR
jgi:hypothetical protein